MGSDSFIVEENGDLMVLSWSPWKERKSRWWFSKKTADTLPQMLLLQTDGHEYDVDSVLVYWCSDWMKEAQTKHVTSSTWTRNIQIPQIQLRWNVF